MPRTVGRATPLRDRSASAPRTEEQETNVDDNPSNARKSRKQRSVGTRGTMSTPRKKVEPAELVDLKLKVEEIASKELDKLLQAVTELEKLTSKVEEDTEDKAKLQQFNIEGDLLKVQELGRYMEQALRSLRNAKHEVFENVRLDVGRHQEKATELQTSIAGYRRACKKYLSQRAEKVKKNNGEAVVL